MIQTPPELKEGNQDGKFEGMTAKHLLAKNDGVNWMDKRKINKFKSNRHHVEFAKNLFFSWNDDGSGVVRAFEIVNPLTSLGLSENCEFIQTLVAAMRQRKSRSDEIKDLKLDIMSFMKLFKSDEVSTTIAAIVREEARRNIN